MRATIVIPTIRENSIREFFRQWKYILRDHRVIVIEDNPEKTFQIEAEHYSWKEIDEDLGSDSWIIPRKTDAIRNYGFILAARDKTDMVVTLDDDCYPIDNPILGHWEELNRDCVLEPWLNTMGDYDIFPRGFPKNSTKISTALNHGMWNNVPDLDGMTQLLHSGLRTTFKGLSSQVSRGILFPMCGMNIAFRPEVIPTLYFMPMGQKQPYHRFADIWTGVIAKKVLDAVGLGVRSGGVPIIHSRASDPAKNKDLEESGLPMNDQLWKLVGEMNVESKTIVAAFLEVMKNIQLGIASPYWTKVFSASQLWVEMVR